LHLDALLADVCLTLPDIDAEFTISCDAITEGLGAVLAQERKSGLRPIAFASRLLRPAEQNYCITELECLAVVYAVQKFLPYIEHTHFVIQTDHIALKNMLSMEEPSGRDRKWSMRLMGLDCTITYKRSPTNLVADALSRAPCGIGDGERDRIVDELLPIEDESGQFKLEFNPELSFSEPHHSCDKCVKVPKVPSTLMPQGPRRPIIISHFTTIREVRDLPANNDDWAEAQEQDPEHSAIAGLVLDEDSRILELVYTVNCDCVLMWWSAMGDQRIVVPSGVRRPLMHAMHDHPLASHLGVLKTYHKLATQFTWRGMRADVRSYNKRCKLCQKVKPSNHAPFDTMASIPSLKRGDALSCDLIGPLPKSHKGHEHALVIVDEFSRNIEIFPLRKATTLGVCDRLVDYCCRNGFPKSIRSDNRPQFASRLWDNVCKILKIKPRKLVPYRPQGNPTECANRTKATH
jgi:hypothetical protein